MGSDQQTTENLRVGLATGDIWINNFRSQTKKPRAGAYKKMGGGYCLSSAIMARSFLRLIEINWVHTVRTYRSEKHCSQSLYLQLIKILQN